MLMRTNTNSLILSRIIESELASAIARCASWRVTAINASLIVKWYKIQAGGEHVTTAHGTSGI